MDLILSPAGLQEERLDVGSWTLDLDLDLDLDQCYDGSMKLVVEVWRVELLRACGGGDPSLLSAVPGGALEERWRRRVEGGDRWWPCTVGICRAV